MDYAQVTGEFDAKMTLGLSLKEFSILCVGMIGTDVGEIPVERPLLSLLWHVVTRVLCGTALGNVLRIGEFLVIRIERGLVMVVDLFIRMCVGTVGIIGGLMMISMRPVVGIM